jgi:hypothetical protein
MGALFLMWQPPSAAKIPFLADNVIMGAILESGLELIRENCLKISKKRFQFFLDQKVKTLIFALPIPETVGKIPP